jgi:hypothetical protein
MAIIKIQRKEGSVTWGVTDTKTGKTKQKYENCFDKWVPGISKISGALMTGLSPEDESVFELALSLSPKELSKHSEYWNNFSVIIPAEGLILDDEDALTQMILKCFAADPTIAKTLEASQTMANCSYIITTETGEAKNKNIKRDTLAQAYKLFAEMSETDINDALYIFGKDPSTTSKEVCKNTLGEILDKDPEKFLGILGDPKVKDKVWIIRLIRAGILSKSGMGTGFEMPIYYNDLYLGKGLDETIANINSKEQANVLIGLKQAYKEAQKK